MSDYGLPPGSIELTAAGPIAFGPDGILFLADNAGARVVAVAVDDPGPRSVDPAPFDLDDLDVKVAALLGVDPEDLAIRDVAVHPGTGNIYLSVQRGLGGDGTAVLVRVDRADASIVDVPLTDVPSSAVSIADAPSADDERQVTSLPLGNEGEEIRIGDGRTIRILREPIRTATITDLAYVDGLLFVAGLSNEEFSSKLRRIPFPFPAAGDERIVASNLEIFHVSHGKWETAAPIRTFVPYDGGRAILASYTCTPVVHFPLTDLLPGAKAVGRTVAELGAVNQPLGMVTYTHDGREYLLVANSAHGLVKIDCADIDGQPALTEPSEPIGVPRETEEIRGVRRLANLDAEHVLALQDRDGRLHLRSLKTAAL